MKRLYSTKDFKWYTLFKQVLYDLELHDKNYLWLISDIEAYPTREKYQELLYNNEYLLLTTGELVDMLEEDDFQWVWAVFSAIPNMYEKEDILRFDLPYIENIEEGQYNPHTDEPKLQHPCADFEIYAVDSSCMFIISDDTDIISKFQKSYPRCTEE